jgi:lipooligosaccharide transport system permease protein
MVQAMKVGSGQYSKIALPQWRTLVPILTRFWWEYRSLWKALIMRDLLDRLIYLVAFGYGMGAIVKTMHGMPYLNFLVPGIAASTGIFVMTMAMTYGVWERSSSYKLYAAWLATPVRLHDILLAELLYASLRTLPSIVILFVLAGLMGGVGSLTGALVAIPVLLLANVTFGAMALCFTVHIHRPLHFAYVNTLWTTPMFLFSGVFFDLSHAPAPLWWFSQMLPLTHVINLVRPLLNGLPLDLGRAVFDFGALFGVALLAYFYAARVMQGRLNS